MSETFVVHIVFNLSEHGLRFYASLPSVFQSFLRAEQFFGSPLVLSKPMIQFYRPVSFCFKTAASQGTAFTPDSSVPCIFADISGCGFHIPGAYPPHPLPQSGFKRAFVTIFDANMTVIITSCILFFLGSATVKGFAFSLGLGVAVSMFTAITVSRTLLMLLINANWIHNPWWFGGKKGDEANV